MAIVEAENGELPKPLHVGDLASELELTGFDGKPLRLADSLGKFVLLDLWRVWGRPEDADLPFLKIVRTRFGDHPLFAIIGISGGPRRADGEQIALKEKIEWLMGMLDDTKGDSPIPSRYGADGRSSVILIGPDGRIIAMGLHGAAIDVEVAKALMR